MVFLYKNQPRHLNRSLIRVTTQHW